MLVPQSLAYPSIFERTFRLFDKARPTKLGKPIGFPCIVIALCPCSSLDSIHTVASSTHDATWTSATSLHPPRYRSFQYVGGSCHIQRSTILSSQASRLAGIPHIFAEDYVLANFFCQYRHLICARQLGLGSIPCMLEQSYKVPPARVITHCLRIELERRSRSPTFEGKPR